MRPPMQSAALQQNEVHRQHSHPYAQQQPHHQQQHQQHPLRQPHHPQQQLPVQVTAIDTPQQQARKFKFEQHEFAIEKHLNFVTGTTTARATPAVARQSPRSNTQRPQQPTYQPQSHFVRDSERQIAANEDCIQLLDFGKSPPATAPPHVPPHSTAYVASQHAAAADTFRRASNAQRTSYISQYSRSSSSEDGSISSYPRASHFDDAAENFIIHFPADSPLHNQNDCGINLPLSETEPLLTNVEATVADTQRAIRLNKNSASLIFTKKEVAPHNSAALPRYYLPATAAATNNNCSASKVQQQKRQQQQLQHSLSLRSANDYNRKQVKHLPATYQQHQQPQQQRRSLQLNYNNNLVTTANCSANNNYCCTVGVTAAKCGSGGGNASGATVLHGKHHHYHPHQHHIAQTSTALSAASNSNDNTNTAAAIRKQHAYSWYAPVYSALEEELEQDSRDSSPIHNLANTKKQHSNHYQHRSSHNSTSAADNETVALLETRNQINIQAQLHAQVNHTNSRESDRHQQQTRRAHAAAQAPSSLTLPHAHNASLNGGSGIGVGNGGVGVGSNGSSIDYNGGLPLNGYEVDGQLASSLGLTGTQLPRRRRIENFLKSLVGLKPSSTRSTSSNSNSNNGSGAEVAVAPMPNVNSSAQLHIPASPEITITRTPSEQNLVVMRDPAGRSNRQQLLSSGEKLTNGSTTSLNVVQQKLLNIMRRNGSATSLHQEKSQSIVQYKGLRKCETVLALTRQTSLCSPGSCMAGGGNMVSGMRRTRTTGSGIFNANGIEQIRPLNRLRNSMTSMNATCSRCSSLLSLAASGSRYSLNMSANGGFVHAALPTSVSQQQLQGMTMLECKPPPHSSHQHQQQQQQRKISNVSSSNVSNSIISSSRLREESQCSVAATIAAANSDNGARSTSGSCSRKSSAGAHSAHSASSNSPPSNITTATLNSSYTPSTPASTPTTPTPTPTPTVTHSATSHANTSGILLVDLPSSALLSTAAPISTPPPTPSSATSTAPPPTYAPATRTSQVYPYTITSLLSMSTVNETSCAQDLTDGRDSAPAPTPAAISAISNNTNAATLKSASSASSVRHQQPCPAPTPFQSFTCKLCLVDVETSSEATTLLQCGCQFCTECMKAYVDFEITEGAYEISCPDAQCPAQGVITLPEIANLTTSNLMKKHHRYRLNKEIEMDKTRTWCPRAGCETVCLVGAGTHSDATPSTSSAYGNASTSTPLADGGAQLLCAVQCPSCKDEFCSACKKTWHPNISCEEHSRRLVADGQDDIGIPFDNDLIKSCPMCHVPIEKDEGCAQMMCKRCKHVFCWYCLASLDDDFLLRHYDRGPCKNKLGHSRASVVWHRAQVIGIFAGFGILLLVASPLLLLAAPCIICCKCRSCSGSKIDEGDVDLDEAAALHSN